MVYISISSFILRTVPTGAVFVFITHEKSVQILWESPRKKLHMRKETQTGKLQRQQPGGQVQRSLDRKTGLHLTPQKADFPLERVMTLAHSLTDPTVPDETIQRRARSGTENIIISIHDDYIEENAKFRTKAGIKCYITRTTDGKCCPWCTSIAGRYEYGKEPSDIYCRHDNCTCLVTFENGRERQNVWSKQSWSEEKEREYLRKLDEEKRKKREALKQRKELAGQKKPTVLSRQQAEWIQEQNLNRGLTNGENSGTINSGGKITDKNFTQIEKFEKQAKDFYDARVRNNDDVKVISKNTGFSEEDISAIKNHLMVEEHLFENGSIRKFDPNIDQALAWQRMMTGNTKETDILLLNHELRELKYMKETGCDYETAHKFSSQKYDWQEAIESTIDMDNINPDFLK